MTRERWWIGLVSLCAVAILFAAAVNGAAYTPRPTADPIEPDPWIAFNATKDDHKTGWALTNYEDDANALKSLPAETDDRIAQPVTLDLADTYAPGVIQENVMAHAGSCGSDKWNETGCWAETETGGGAGTISEATVDGFGKAVRFKHVGPTGASDTVWKYDLVDRSADFTKTRFIVGVRVHQVDASTEARISVVNSGGELKSYLIDDAGTLYQNNSCDFRIHSAAVVVIAAGVPAFYDDKPAGFGGTCTYTNQDIAEIRVQLKDVDAGAIRTIDISIVALTLDTKQLKWGLTSDGADVNNETFAMGQRSMASFAPTFTYSRIGDLKVALRAFAHNLLAANVTRTGETTTVGSYVRLVHYRFDFKLPAVTDLTYANLVMHDALTLTKEHYKAAAINGVDKIMLYSCSSCKVGTIVVLLSAPVAGTNYAVLLDTYYTEAEYNSISDPPTGLGAQIESSVIGAVIFVAMLIGLGGAGALGLRRRKAALRGLPPR